MSNITPIEKGQIRHSKKVPQALMKCCGPFESTAYKPDGTILDTATYILTRDFPSYHYIVVTDIVESSIIRGVWFCVVHLITHSNHFDNIKIAPKLFNIHRTKISLINSYITRDKFLINIDEIEPTRSYGAFNLIKLQEVIEG